MTIKNDVKTGLVLLIVITLGATFLSTGTVSANRTQGVDWSRYQTAQGEFGYANDTFMLAQIGGYTAKIGLYPQTTYASQIKAARAKDLHAHSYFWWEDITARQQVDKLLAYVLPKVKTPHDSIIAIDFEAGPAAKATNTKLLVYAMNKIKAKGYTPMLYSSKYFLLVHVQLETILKQFGACLWVAGYRDMNLATTPDYHSFPSLPGVAIWQFTSNYVAGDLDGNVDLLGVTHKGYIANKPTQKHVTQKISKPQTKSSKSKNRTKGVHKPYLTSLLKKFFVFYSNLCLMILFLVLN